MDERLSLKTSKCHDGKFVLEAILSLFDDKQKQWKEKTSMIVGVFSSLADLKSWEASDDGSQSINRCFDEIKRVSEKEPYEDWDW